MQWNQLPGSIDNLNIMILLFKLNSKILFNDQFKLINISNMFTVVVF